MITTEDVKNLEKLSRIRLSDAEREEYTAQMSSIIDYINEIQELELSDEVESYTHNNIFRDDVVKVTEGHREKALANAPESLGEYYKVSQVIKQ